MNTVVVPDVFTAANNYTVTKSGTIGRNQTKSYFFNVPVGAPAFKVDFTVRRDTWDGAGALLALPPYGVGIDSNASNNCYARPWPAARLQPNSRTSLNPHAGVWEVTVDARRNSDGSDSGGFTLTATLLGATVSPNRT